MRESVLPGKKRAVFWNADNDWSELQKGQYPGGLSKKR